MWVYVVGPLPESVEDWTLRQQRVLREAAFVAVAGEVHEALPGKLFALEEDPAENARAIVERLEHGTGAIAWIGELPSSLWRTLRELGERGVALISVPGPTALVAALAVSGLPTSPVTLLGPLPAAREARRRALQHVSADAHTIVCQVEEDPTGELWADLAQILGDRRIAWYREGVIRQGRVDTPVPIEARYVLVIEGAAAGDQRWDEGRVRERVRALLDEGGSVRDVAREIARQSGWPRRWIYRIVMDERGGQT